jgi:hypothetical protein
MTQAVCPFCAIIKGEEPAPGSSIRTRTSRRSFLSSRLLVGTLWSYPTGMLLITPILPNLRADKSAAPCDVRLGACVQRSHPTG